MICDTAIHAELRGTEQELETGSGCGRSGLDDLPAVEFRSRSSGSSCTPREAPGRQWRRPHVAHAARRERKVIRVGLLVCRMQGQQFPVRELLSARRCVARGQAARQELARSNYLPADFSGDSLSVLDVVDDVQPFLLRVLRALRVDGLALGGAHPLVDAVLAVRGLPRQDLAVAQVHVHVANDALDQLPRGTTPKKYHLAQIFPHVRRVGVVLDAVGTVPESRRVARGLSRGVDIGPQLRESRVLSRAPRRHLHPYRAGGHPTAPGHFVAVRPRLRNAAPDLTQDNEQHRRPDSRLKHTVEES
ncbi:unnamed protein product [Ixodes pacificus]